MHTKICKVRERRYMVPGKVNSLTGFFAVPKGDNDIRIVYDATKCGLNDALWTPNFFLPTIDTILRNSDSTSWFGDIDLGEMFLNYFLDEELRSYAGVDTRISSGKAAFDRWERTLMGIQSSPYVCTQTFHWGADIIKGDRTALDNPLRWDEVLMNLPGAVNYDPSKPWVYRWDSQNQCIASFFGTYIDDIRTVGGSEKIARDVTRRTAALINYLGQQDAPRKRRPPSQEPGARAGALCMSTNGGLFVSCTQVKWDKAKAIIQKYVDRVSACDLVNMDSFSGVGSSGSSGSSGDASSLCIDYKETEKDIGFLVHMSRTYPAMFPYLKGFYHSMHAWRGGRDTDGWKYNSKQWKEFLEMEEDAPTALLEELKAVAKHDGPQTRPSGLLKAVPRLRSDIAALAGLFESQTPTHRLIRGKSVRSARFGFGDASGSGFGSSWLLKDGVKYRTGVWGSDMNNSSSNRLELCNLVETLEEMGNDGDLDGVEVFLFTDNSTAEAVFFNGSSKSEHLFNLVLRVRKLEMTRQCKIHLCHVAGERMISQSTDGLSRGNLVEGVMKGDAISSFVPIHQCGLSRSSQLKPWLLSWLGKETEFLEPKDWFIRGNDLVDGSVEFNDDGIAMPTLKPGTFVWSPAPAAAETAVEELRIARHTHQESMHIVVIPRLMTPLWRKQLTKAADIMLSLPPGHPAWPSDMFEPLTIAILFPFVSHRPWQLRRCEKLLGLAESLSKVWKTSASAEGPVLRELRNFQRRLVSLSERMACKLLRSK